MKQRTSHKKTDQIKSLHVIRTYKPMYCRVGFSEKSKIDGLTSSMWRSELIQ